jgi:thiol-disulfide isomerase/thioredoxin
LLLVIALLPGLLIGLALAGCDRQKAADPQGNAPAAAAAPAPPGNAPAPAAAAPGHPPYPTGRLDRSHAGTAAPDTAFEDGNGRPVRLSAFRGRPLLVNLWATWCGPCVVEMPSLDALALRQSEAIKVLTISQDADDGRRKVADFFAARNFQRLEPYLDSRMDLMMGLRLDTLPTTILYDAQGREVWRMTGMADWSGDRATRLLGEADPG